ncbi:MAG: CBS domain-containing protein, partial [Deltaproteobacteria bacterium]|nr:CBS domain-containing protein [Deltaproteobacteria bacterium]
MKKTYVKDIMVPLSDYATVSKNANLLEAILALENETKTYGEKPYRHQSVLVVDEKGDVIGKVSQMDIMAALEPNYKKIGTDIDLSHYGFSLAFIKAMQDQYDLWEKPLAELCNNVDTINVTKIMYTPADNQKVKKSDTLDTAMHQILMGRHHSLLVTKRNKIVGILRSTDVFNCLFDKIGAC